MSLLDINEIKEHRFKQNELDKAQKLQTKMNERYGYKPEILHVFKQQTKESFYIIVESKGLKRI